MCIRDRDEKERALRCEEILTIQAMGLKKRLLHTHANTAVVGISGGLDSTLALIVTAKAFDMIGKAVSYTHLYRRYGSDSYG